MKRFKYPAPFDKNESSWDKLQQLYSDPNIPLAPVAPLPINVIDSMPEKRQISLYKDLFGNDTSVLVEILDAKWADENQRSLATKILFGNKNLCKLSRADEIILDSIAVGLNAKQEKDENKQPEENNQLEQISAAYEWLK
ncbi:MAG: hypothetical protein ACFFFC_00390 [Candidatus Thorarchaeota archaeon]